MTSVVRWYDAATCTRFGEAPSNVDSASELPYTPAEGSAEAMLTTLLATWREEASPLIFGDHPCKWLVISGTGPGDLRGFAMPPGGEPYSVSVETKISPSTPLKKGIRGVVLSQFKKAIEQAVDGLMRSRAAYKDDAERWLRLTPSPSKGAIVLAADSWKIPPDVVEQAFREMLSKVVVPEFLGPQATLRCAVIGVKRFASGPRQLVRVETCYDALLSPAG
jgi:hypothetical protein